MRAIGRAALAALLLLPVVSQPAAADSLYKRLGGYDAIAAVTDDFLAALKADADFAPFFVGLSDDTERRVRQNIVDLFCQTTGGPCFYVGRDVKLAHQGLGITKAEWDKSLGIFVAIMNKYQIGAQEQQDLAAALAPLEPAVVDTP